MAAYIIKYAKEPSEKIAYRILWPYLATVEHIHAKSQGGVNNMSNYAIATARENSDRLDIELSEQILRRPNTAKNSQKQINRLIVYAQMGIFAKEGISTDYIKQLKETMALESEGEILLDISKLDEGGFCIAKSATQPLNLDKENLRILKS